MLARQKGLEPLTYGLEGRCSIQLSYWREKAVTSEQSPGNAYLSIELLSSLVTVHCVDGRGEPIRTADPLRPRQVRYQAALRPVK